MIKKLMMIAAMAFLAPMVNAAEEQKAPATTQGAEISAVEVAPEATEAGKDEAAAKAQEATQEGASKATTESK